MPLLWAKSQLHDAFALVDLENRVARWLRWNGQGEHYEEQMFSLAHVVPSGIGNGICAVSAQHLFLGLCPILDTGRKAAVVLGWNYRSTSAIPLEEMPLEASLHPFIRGDDRMVVVRGNGATKTRHKFFGTFPYHSSEKGPEFFPSYSGRPFCYLPRNGRLAISERLESSLEVKNASRHLRVVRDRSRKIAIRRDFLLATAKIGPNGLGVAPVEAWCFPSPRPVMGEEGQRVLSLGEEALGNKELWDLWSSPDGESFSLIVREPESGIFWAYDFSAPSEGFVNSTTAWCPSPWISQPRPAKRTFHQQIGNWFGTTRLGAWVIAGPEDQHICIGPHTWSQKSWLMDHPGSKLIFAQEAWRGEGIVGLETDRGNPVFKFLGDADRTKIQTGAVLDLNDLRKEGSNI